MSEQRNAEKDREIIAELNSEALLHWIDRSYSAEQRVAELEQKITELEEQLYFDGEDGNDDEELEEIEQ